MPDAIEFESDAGSPPASLPRGRHKLPVETVRASQRQRLLRAMLEAVGQQGYDATTVPQVVARARVSRNSFYELFADKLDCFLVLCEELSDQLLEETFGPVDLDHWLAAVRYGTVRYLAWWKARPLFARAYLVELPSAGTRAIEQRWRAYGQFAERFEIVARWARHQEPGTRTSAPDRDAIPRVVDHRAGRHGGRRGARRRSPVLRGRDRVADRANAGREPAVSHPRSRSQANSIGDRLGLRPGMSVYRP